VALQSQLFRGDSKLEQAGVSDPAHILPGARGPHVAKIQQALIQLGARIVADGIYGSGTAAAVTDFKQKQLPQILNFEGKIDNIVGIKTMAALDAAMVQNPPKPDILRRYCGNDRRTPVTVRTGAQVRLAFGVTDGKLTGAPSAPDLVTIIRSNATRARDWLRSTLFPLNIFRLQVTIPPDQARLIPIHARLKTHFLFDVDLFKNGPIIAQKAEPRNAQETVADIIEIYTKIDDVMSQSDRNFVTDFRDLRKTPGFTQFATSAAFVPDPPRMDAIHVTPLYLDLGPLKRVSVLIHEAAHFVTKTAFQDIVHIRDPSYPGTTISLAIRNVYSYEQFATHMFLGADRRLQDNE
jgi:hypothetical protein